MSTVILFHHVQGLTEGVQVFGDRLRAAGHQVTVPDLFAGATFDTIDEGVIHAKRLGIDNLVDAGVAAADQLPEHTVYAGFSLGALIAHKLVQTRTGAAGALLYHHGDVPVTMFGESWPGGVDVQFHINEDDDWLELDVVEAFVERVKANAQAKLFLYPGSDHLFLDSSLNSYDPESARRALQRSLRFLADRG